MNGIFGWERQYVVAHAYAMLEKIVADWETMLDKLLPTGSRLVPDWETMLYKLLPTGSRLVNNA